VGFGLASVTVEAKNVVRIGPRPALGYGRAMVNDSQKSSSSFVAA
jgi:hypothetical protein